MKYIHGVAILHEPVLDKDGNVLVEAGSMEAVTAYLQEMETFAVYFSGNNWITFKEDKRMSDYKESLLYFIKNGVTPEGIEKGMY